MLQAATKKPRKLTDHGKQLLPGALISNVIHVVFYKTETIMGNDRWREKGRGGGEQKKMVKY